MFKSMNFKNDSHDERAQERTEALRLLDMMVHQCYHKNKARSDDPKYEPRMAIYLGTLEYSSLRSSMPSNPMTNVVENYRGYPVTRVTDDTHCRVFCLNPVVK